MTFELKPEWGRDRQPGEEKRCESFPTKENSKCKCPEAGMMAREWVMSMKWWQRWVAASLNKDLPGMVEDFNFILSVMWTQI